MLHAQSDGTYDWCLAYLAPPAYEDAFRYPPSGDTYDEDQVMARLRRGAGQDGMHGAVRFARYALSPVIFREERLSGERAEEIMLEAACAFR